MDGGFGSLSGGSGQAPLPAVFLPPSSAAPGSALVLVRLRHSCVALGTVPNHSGFQFPHL